MFVLYVIVVWRKGYVTVENAVNTFAANSEKSGLGGTTQTQNKPEETLRTLIPSYCTVFGFEFFSFAVSFL